MPDRCHRLAPRQRGFSLVELMVAVTIGSAIVLLLATLTGGFERQKNITVGAGSTGDASAVALGLMRSAIGSAGHGLNFPNAIGCQFRLYREADDAEVLFTNTTALPNPPGLFPVFIAQGAAGASDTLTVASGSSRQFSETFLQTTHNGDTAALVTASGLGFFPPSLATPGQGDVILLTQTAGGPCRIREVSARVGNTLSHAGGAVRFNDPDGTGAGLVFNAGGPTNGGAKLTNLGLNPTIRQFTVANQRFTMAELFAGTNDVLFDHAITLQAQYGFFNAATGALDWCDTRGGAGCAAATWDLLSAVRLALVLRSPNLDCAANSPTTITWAEEDERSAPDGTAWTWGSFDVSGLTNASCYRYQVVQTIAPVRNMLWSATQ